MVCLGFFLFCPLTCEISSCWRHRDPLHSHMPGWWTCAPSAARSPSCLWPGWLPLRWTCPGPLPRMEHFVHGSGSHKSHLSNTSTAKREFIQNGRHCFVLLKREKKSQRKCNKFRWKKNISHRFWGCRCCEGGGCGEKQKARSYRWVIGMILGEGEGVLVSQKTWCLFKPFQNSASSHAGRNWKDVERHFTGVLKIPNQRNENKPKM